MGAMGASASEILCLATLVECLSHLKVPASHFRLPLRLSAQWAPALILAIGSIGLLDDSRRRRGFAEFINAHALFGVWVVVFVTWRFHLRMRRLPRPQLEDIRAISRDLSRLVYLLLGLAVLFMKLAPSGADDLQGYLGDALAALVVIRLLTIAYWRRVRRAG